MHNPTELGTRNNWALLTRHNPTELDWSLLNRHNPTELGTRNNSRDNDELSFRDAKQLSSA